MLPAQARVTRQRVTQEPSTTESAEADAQGGQQDQRAKPSSSWIRSEPQKPQQYIQQDRIQLLTLLCVLLDFDSYESYIVIND